MRLHAKILLFWLASVLAVLLLVALFFQLSLNRYHDRLAAADLAVAFDRLDGIKARLRADVREQAATLSGRADVVSSINLISNYQDPDDYQPLVFDAEKWNLAEKLAETTGASGLRFLAVYDRDLRLVAYHLAGGGSGDLARLNKGIVSYQGGVPVYRELHGLDENIRDTTTAPAHLSQVTPTEALEKTVNRLVAGKDGLVVAALSPIWRKRHGRLAVVQGYVAVADVMDEAAVVSISQRTGAQFFYRLPNGTRRGAVFGQDAAALAAHHQEAHDAFIVETRPLTLADGVTAEITFALPRKKLDSEIDSIRTAILWVMVLVAVVMTPLGYFWVQRSISRPVGWLMAGVHAMKAGDTQALDAYRSNDELGTLADALSDMSATINKREGQLTRARDTLERRVEERTADLTREISVRAKAEEALRYSEQRFRDLAEAASDWFWETDAEHCFIDMAGAGPERLGKRRDAIMGHTRWDVISDQDKAHDPEGWQRHRAQVEALEPFRDFEYAVTGDDGVNRLISVSGKPVYDGDGVFIGHRGTAHDVTERRDMQMQLIQASKMATLGEMATGVAHELNQPLNVIRMAAANIERKLRKGTPGPEYLVEKLAKIDANVERAVAIIDHMRIFGRSERAVSANVDIGKVVESAVSMIGEQIRLSGIDLDLDLPDTCPPISANVVQLEQVVLNLISNARDALTDIKDDGEGEKSITITLSPWTPEHAQKFGLERADAAVSACAVFVRDSAGGIPLGVLDRIFEPFFTTKEIGKGTGLGLSISYGIMQDMGGSLHVRNTTSGGAEFAMVMPVTATA